MAANVGSQPCAVKPQGERSPKPFAGRPLLCDKSWVGNLYCIRRKDIVGHGRGLQRRLFGLGGKLKGKRSPKAPVPTSHQVVNSAQKRKTGCGVERPVECADFKVSCETAVWRRRNRKKSRGLELLATDSASARDSVSDWSTGHLPSIFIG